MNIKMNKIWKLVIVALVITTSACGQQRGVQGGPQQGNSQQQGQPALPTDDQIEEMVEDLSSEISMSEEQESKVLELYQEHFEAVENKIRKTRKK